MRKWRRLLFPALFVCLFFSSLACNTASAAQTNVITSAKKVTGGKWVTSSKGKRYKTADGKYLKNAWIKVSGKVYRLDTKGYCETGWFTWNKNKYYADKNGAVYYKKWYTDGKSRYYLQSTGVRAASKWLKVNGKYYYFEKTGKMSSNKIIGLYYVGPSGVRVTSCWVKKNGKFYYFGSDGKRLSGTWVKSSQGYRYLGSDGAMAVDKWVGKYYVGSDGYRLTNCEKDGYWLNETGLKTVRVFQGDYIFVGDSRMVGMYHTVAPVNTLFIAKVGSGYTWLNETAGVKLKYYLDASPKVKVVLALGVNDLGNISLYLAYYRELVSLYPDTEFYFLSVNPVDDQYLKSYNPTAYQWVNNAAIQKFNKNLKSAFSKKYIDSCSYLKKKGFGTADGIHYTADTYRKIYLYIKDSIR